MRLLNTLTLKLEEFMVDPPAYAILSHTWVNNEEYLYGDIEKGTGQQKQGYEKVRNFCKFAAGAGYTHAWVDTCCIDKSSSAELSEAINSMFAWYSQAELCLVYLDIDINGKELTAGDLNRSRWITRGWTLQELIAPGDVEFYSKGWVFCGTRKDLHLELSTVTRIDAKLLRHGGKTIGTRLQKYSIAQKMCWASNRKTTRPEDIAYCLIGLFDVSLTPLYGEGCTKAFLRLQEEIIKHSPDLSILTWTTQHFNNPNFCLGALAQSPSWFAGCHDICYRGASTEPFMVTNQGLRVKLPFIKKSGKAYKKRHIKCSGTLVLPGCIYKDDPALRPLGIQILRYSDSGQLANMQGVEIYWRGDPPYGSDAEPALPLDKNLLDQAKSTKIYIHLTPEN